MPGKGAREEKERRGKERKSCWACPAPRQGFSHACLALINSFDVPETAAAELPALHYSPCHAEGEGWVSPSALKLSFRPGQGLSFGFGGESMPAPIAPSAAIPAWLAGVCAHTTCPRLAVCDSPPGGQTVLLSLSPLSPFHPSLPRTSKGLAGTLLSPHTGLVGLLHFPMGLAKVWEKPFLSSHHRAVSKFIFDVVASAASFLLYMRDASVDFMGQFVTGRLSLGFFTTLLVPGSRPCLLLEYLILSDLYSDRHS